MSDNKKLLYLWINPSVWIELIARTDSAMYIRASSSLKVSFFINMVIKSPTKKNILKITMFVYYACFHWLIPSSKHGNFNIPAISGFKMSDNNFSDISLWLFYKMITENYLMVYRVWITWSKNLGLCKTSGKLKILA